jgi:hypothetical protein
VRATERLRRVRLFLVSYAPLWLMLAFRALPDDVTWRWTGQPAYGSLIFAGLAGWSFLDGWRLVRGVRRRNAVTMRFTELRDEGGAAGGYLATYLFPLLAVAPSRFGEWAAYALYGAVVAVVFVRTDLALVNPTLYMLGWRVLSSVPVRDDGPSESAVIVVCRNPRNLREPVDVVGLAGCWVTKRERGQLTTVRHL